jgi:hypothetical protein
MTRRGRLWPESTVSRRTIVFGSAKAGAVALVSGVSGFDRAVGEDSPKEVASAGDEDLKPLDAVPALLDALQRFPLVALAERHLLQEWHDFATTLLLHPALPPQLTDVVVEFGNALHQDTADRYLLELKPITQADFRNIWRFTVGGNVLWDAPAYAQFFRTVRAVNLRRPADRRLRVLLGDPPFDHSKVRLKSDLAYVQSVAEQRDSHFADVVQREVVKKNRRALLVAGSAHLLRGLTVRGGANRSNAGGILASRSDNSLFVIDPLILPPGPARDPLTRRVLANIGNWSSPALALLKGTWLGATSESARPWVNASAHLAAKPEGARYAAQADAVLYLGPGVLLTASQADPTLYGAGEYAEELRRVSKVTNTSGRPTDLAGDGLRRARAGPSWFEQWR